MIDFNLTAVIDSTSKAIRAMKEQGGLILNLASAAAFIPLDLMAVHCASKAGVANFTRALASVGMGIRFVDTPILVGLPPLLKDFIDGNMGFVGMERVVTAALSLLDDERMKGECLWIPANRPTQVWPDEERKRKLQLLLKDGSPFPNGFRSPQ